MQDIERLRNCNFNQYLKDIDDTHKAFGSISLDSRRGKMFVCTHDLSDDDFYLCNSELVDLVVSEAVEDCLNNLEVATTVCVKEHGVFYSEDGEPYTIISSEAKHINEEVATKLTKRFDHYNINTEYSNSLFNKIITEIDGGNETVVHS